MRLSCPQSICLALLLANASAFTVVRSPVVGSGSMGNTRLAMASAEEILAKARAAVGKTGTTATTAEPTQPGDGPSPSEQFEASVLDDIRASLFMLERRVKDGPGSLTLSEVEEFEARTKRVVAEMREKDAASEETAVAAVAAPPAPVAAVAPPAPVAVAPPAPVAVAPPAPVKAAPPAPVAPAAPKAPLSTFSEAANKKEPVQASMASILHAVEPGRSQYAVDSLKFDNADENTLEYEGHGGLGLAKGTANTYMLPGMEEMTGPEYRAALQESVLERQRQRRKALLGQVGNRAAMSYLDQLGWGGISKAMSKGRDAD